MLRFLNKLIMLCWLLVAATSFAGAEQTKHELTELWYEASIALGNAGYPEMERLAQIKGVYWLDPSKWTDENIRQSGIELSEMRKKLESALV